MSSFSLIKKLAGQTAIYGLSSIVGRLLNYLLVPIYTRVFLPPEFGVVTELYGYVGFLTVLLTYGMETAFFRYVKEANKPKEVFSTAFLSLLFSTLAFAMVALLFRQSIAELIRYPNHSEYVLWFALILSFDALSALPFARLRYEERPIKFAVIKLLNIALNIGVVLFFIVFCPKYAAQYDFLNKIYHSQIGVGYIFIGNLAASAVTFALLLPDVLRAKLTFVKSLWRQMIIYALPLVVAGFAGIINEMLDRVMLKYLLPHDLETNMAQLGIYGACYKLSILMTLFIQAFRYAAEPFFFSRSVHSDARKTYAEVMNYFAWVCGFIFVGITLFLDVVKHFIGVNYHEGLSVVPILLLANLMLGVYYNLSIWYKLTNKTSYGALIGVLGALVTIVLNFWLIPRIGYMGSAWATLACYTFMVALSYFFGKKHYAIPYELGKLAILLLVALAIYRLDAFLANGSYAQLPLAATYIGKVVLCLAYASLAVLFLGKQKVEV